MPFARNEDGTRLFFEAHSPLGDDSRGVVLLVHGFASSGELWDASIEPLVRSGWRVVAYDMRGHARSDSPSGKEAYSKGKQVSDMECVLAAANVLPQSRENLYIVGHSMGGYDAALFCLANPPWVSGIVLVSTGPGFKSDRGRKRWNAAARRIAEKYESKGMGALVGSDAKKSHRSVNGIIECCKYSYTQRDDDPLYVKLGGPHVVFETLDTFPTPSAIIVGERDRAFLTASKIMSQRMPDATIDVVSGRGHMLLEKDPASFTRILCRCLDRLARTAAIHRSTTRSAKRIHAISRHVAAASASPVLVNMHRDGKIAEIVLNSKESRNAMSSDLLSAFASAVKRIASDKNVRAVVISGTDRYFCCGADMKSSNGAQATGESAMQPAEKSFAMYAPFLSILDIKCPTIANCCGHAVGGGFGLALLCDMRVVNKKAKYGANFTRLGLHPGMACTYLMALLAGIPNAFELLVTGRLFDGAKMMSRGLANYCCDGAEDCRKRAMELAAEVSIAAPVAVRWTKHSIYKNVRFSPKEAAWAEAALQSQTLLMDDFLEGKRAMLEKRDPAHSGS